MPSNMSPGGSSDPLTEEQSEVLEHWEYDEDTRRLISDKAIETTLNSLYLGEQHKMSSGSENIYFTNLSSDINFFPMWGGLKDQSITENRGASGFVPPSGRVYTDMFSLPLGGSPDPLTSVGYSGDNYFDVNISGVGITTVAAETIPETVRLEYRITINGNQVYMQELPRNSPRSSAGTVINPGDVIEWFFDHPVDVHAGTTLYAEIRCVRNADDVDLGIFQVRQGDTVDPNTGLYRYQATVHNRLFEDKDLELISPYLKYQAMDFGVSAGGTSVLFRDLTLVNDTVLTNHPVSTLQAIESGDNISVIQKEGAKVFVESLPVSGVTIDGVAATQVQATAINELNALFQQSGGTSGTAPVITSTATVNLTEGDTLNYELAATNGVGYEWSGLPSGVVTVEGNVRKLVGGSGLAVGTYNITAKAVNYFGEATQSIDVVVSSPPFSNTKSIQFVSNDYLGANAALLDSSLGRSGSGSGSGDAWTVAFWFKGGTSTSGQTIFYYGSNDVTNGGHVELRYVGGSDKLRVRYGSGSNYLQIVSPNDSLPAGNWKHVIVTYDGGTTGASSGDITDYYSRFSMYIDGVLQTPTNTHGNYGWSGAISGQNLRVGRYASGNYLQSALVEELAAWNSDQTSNVAAIYNSGSTHDLTALTSSPAHYWRMGDGDTYPTIQDNVGNAHFVMYNMTAADIVTDAPQ